MLTKTHNYLGQVRIRLGITEVDLKSHDEPPKSHDNSTLSHGDGHHNSPVKSTPRSKRNLRDYDWIDVSALADSLSG